MLVWTLVAVALLSPTPAAHGRCLKDVPEVNPKRYFRYADQTLDIIVETSRRVSHRLATHVFKLFLEEVMGYPRVVVVDQGDDFDSQLVYDRLSGSAAEDSPIPTAMVNLEVWVPPNTTIDFGSLGNSHVRELGKIAPPGRFGWFVPKDLSQIIPGMDHWHIFTDPSSASVFNVSESDWSRIVSYTRDEKNKKYFCEESFCENGMYVPDRCKSFRHSAVSCAVLFAGFSRDTRFVQQHIDEMQLYVKVVWLGPNLRNVTRDLARRYRDKGAPARSLAILTWIPSAVTADRRSSFLEVAFPPCDMYSPRAGAPCHYVMQRLVKLYWIKLQSGAWPAYEALRKMTFTEDEYNDIINLYIEGEGRSYESIACDWMSTNSAVWKQWVPSIHEKNVLRIGGIFPISGSSYTAKGIARAALMALTAVNKNDTILRDYQLVLNVDNGQCKSDVVMKTFIEYIIFDMYNELAGILGPACSDTVEPLAGVTRHFRTVVISYSAEGSTFSDREKYKYFFRTIGENKQYEEVYLQLLRRFQWRQVAALTEDGQKYTEYISDLQDLLEKHNISVSNRKFPRDRKQNEMMQYLVNIKKENRRIIIADLYDTMARAVMCEAYRLQMTARQGYVWFLPLWLTPDWYNTDLHNNATGEDGSAAENISCSTAEMKEAINGHLALTHAYFAPDEELMEEGITVGEWRNMYKEKCQSKKELESTYAGFAYDAVWVYALALNTLMKEDQSYLSALHSEATTRRYVEILEATDFHGVSGRIQFTAAGSRKSIIHVVQWLNATTNIVGQFYPNTSTGRFGSSGDLILNESAIVWLTPDGGRPGDGKLGPPACVLDGIARGLGVSCEVAIVIVNIMGFGLLGTMLIIAFFVVKRRYDKKVQQTKNYIKSLGIDLLPPMSGLDKWEIPRDKVVINRKLGEGAFGTVYGGEAYFNEKGWVAVAVKTLKVGSRTEEKLDFLSEAEVMKRFDHKNIVRLLGVCTKNEPVYTVMEFMLYGDLKTFLLARRHLVNEKMSEESDEISSKKLTSMALDVARALSYLAELKYVHRDVASRNCLVNASRVVKLGDFGMTRPMYESDYYKFNRKGMLPVRWMAPESLGLGIFTPSSDVWSYGVMLYEIITFGSFPFQGLSNNQVLEHVKAGNVLTIPTGIKPLLEGLIRSCWNADPKKRPQASEIVEFLANNPRLIAPCLDVPLSSVQIEDSNQLELQLPEGLRKCSVSLRGAGLRARHPSVSGGRDAENGCACEPLLGAPRSASARCVPARRPSEDYMNQDSSRTDVSML
ncbi:atrial natriuretic peptide receptor 2-like [Bacillus rossius redtenbacheri]|uniref:atrial natriuretic peptide receptor 2-like n=1 Tax=Bacillus rossius redtenbacheri TaxID=93214 RepID=UPI002FDE7AA6